LDCIRIDHDPKLIVLAVLVSLLSGFTIFAILSHARAQRGSAQYGWSVMAACVAGGGIWSTHFVAMLGFSPATAVSYDINLTIISALLGIGISGIAMPLLLSRAPVNALVGAVVLSTAIGTMHFTGMKALVFGGTLDWEPALVALSLFSAVLLVSAAIFTERLSTSPRYRLVAAALFGAAICCLHFTAMAAAVLKSDPTLAVADGGLSEFLLGLSVAFVTSIIVVLSLATVFFDKRAQRASTDADQVRSIIEVAQTGIVVCQNQRVIAANRTFGQLVSLNQEEIEGRPLADFIATRALTGERSISCHRDVEAQLKTSAGTSVDVALSATPILSSGAPRHLIEVRDIRAEKAAREHMVYLANHDALTGLPNLRLFRTELHRAIEVAAASCDEVGLLLLDLDHFKDVNDTYGHAVGDALLCSVAARFRSVLGERHLLARVGGDEFVVLCWPRQKCGDPAAVALRLLAATSEPILINDKRFDIALSIGLAMYPHDADTPDTLLHKADTALYEVKKTGRGRWSRAA
jgi:diguanylate cyclase (GGDEF)-like protein/PAS domain S-box-containing protein